MQDRVSSVLPQRYIWLFIQANLFQEKQNSRVVQGMLETGCELILISRKAMWHLNLASPLSIWEPGNPWGPHQGLICHGYLDYVDRSPPSKHSPVPEWITGIEILGS